MFDLSIMHLFYCVKAEITLNMVQQKLQIWLGF